MSWAIHAETKPYSIYMYIEYHDIRIHDMFNETNPSNHFLTNKGIFMCLLGIVGRIGCPGVIRLHQCVTRCKI